MHFDQGQLPVEYTRYIGRKAVFITAVFCFLMVLLVVSISLGAVSIHWLDVLRTLTGFKVSNQYDIIIWNIRLPQALAAIVGGSGLAVAGAVMQSILRNPLGSPFTLGISHAAAFGASFAVMLLSSGVMTGMSIADPYLTTAMAFLFCLIAAGIIMAVSKIRGASPEVMVLTGVALGALFTAGTMFLQFFADDVQLAAMVFWTFGDAARANWNELIILSVVTAAAAVFFMLNGWNYNAVETGEETAKGLGVKVGHVRLSGMLVASLVTAVIVAFLGIIGFVGLVCPHIVRRIIGGDHRFLVPATLFFGGGLLLASDTAARLMFAPHLLPVSVLTAFMGAPIFIYLIIRGSRR
jgi:iron complex transport system permease protein